MKIKLTIMTLFIAVTAMAQGPGRHQGEKAGHRIDKLDSIVNLTDNQRTELQSIQREHFLKMKELRNSDSKPTREDHQLLRDELKTQMDAVLTPEQKAALQNHKDSMKSKMKVMRTEIREYRETNISPSMDRLHADLMSKLTDEEKAKIEATKLRLREMRKEFCSSDSSEHNHGKRLSREQRAEMHEYAKAELSGIVKAHKAEFDKIRTDLQPLRETWKADMKAIHQKHMPEDGMHKAPFNKDKKRGFKAGKNSKKANDANRTERQDIRFLLKSHQADHCPEHRACD